MRYAAVTFLFFISAFAKAGSCSFSLMEKTLGVWQATDGKTIVKESWHKVSAKTIEGYGETSLQGQIKNRESMRIVEMTDGLFYIAKVSHNDVPIAFKLVKCTDDTFVFKNEKHDFPKRIEYKFFHRNKMLVKVSDGKEEGFTINFARTNTH